MSNSRSSNAQVVTNEEGIGVLVLANQLPNEQFRPRSRSEKINPSHAKKVDDPQKSRSTLSNYYEASFNTTAFDLPLLPETALKIMNSAEGSSGSIIFYKPASSYSNQWQKGLESFEVERIPTDFYYHFSCMRIQPSMSRGTDKFGEPFFHAYFQNGMVTPDQLGCITYTVAAAVRDLSWLENGFLTKQDEYRSLYYLQNKDHFAVCLEAEMPMTPAVAQPVIVPSSTLPHAELPSFTQSSVAGLTGFALGLTEAISQRGLAYQLEKGGYNEKTKQLVYGVVEFSISATLFYLSHSYLSVGLTLTNKLFSYLEGKGLLSEDIRYVSNILLTVNEFLKGNFSQLILLGGCSLGHYVGEQAVNFANEQYKANNANDALTDNLDIESYGEPELRIAIPNNLASLPPIGRTSSWTTSFWSSLTTAKETMQEASKLLTGFNLR